MRWALPVLLVAACGPDILPDPPPTATTGDASTGHQEPPQGTSSGPGATSVQPGQDSTTAAADSTTGEPGCWVEWDGESERAQCLCYGNPPQPASQRECGPCGATDSQTCACEGGLAPISWCSPPPMVCALPERGSWCAVQREVAIAIGCRHMDPVLAEDCYRTVGAQYTYTDLAVLMAGDCSTSIDGPMCEDPYVACTNAAEPFSCELWQPASEDVCTTLAQQEGASAEEAQAPCTAIVETFGP